MKEGIGIQVARFFSGCLFLLLLALPLMADNTIGKSAVKSDGSSFIDTSKVAKSNAISIENVEKKEVKEHFTEAEKSPKMGQFPTSYPKFVYVKLATSLPLSKSGNALKNEGLSKPIYIGQNFKVTYTITPYKDARLIDSLFSRSIVGAKIVHRPKSFKLNDDGSFSAMYIFQVTKPKVLIPPFVIIAKDDVKKDSDISDSIALRASPLKGGRLYTGVLASSLEILSTYAKSYDTTSNIIILELSATNSNLEKFHLKDALKQGLESTKADASTQNSYDANHGNLVNTLLYYAIVPKSLKMLEFSYYNVPLGEFQTLSTDIIVHNDVVAAQDNISPKKNIFNLTNIALLLLVIAIIGVTIYLRRWWIILFAILLLGYMIYSNFYDYKVLYLKAPARVSILPTSNSTLIKELPSGAKIKLVDKMHGYYKVLFEDDKIGWIKQDEIQN